jgi:hypothetical protein
MPHTRRAPNPPEKAELLVTDSVLPTADYTVITYECCSNDKYHHPLLLALANNSQGNKLSTCHVVFPNVLEGEWVTFAVWRMACVMSSLHLQAVVVKE